MLLQLFRKELAVFRYIYLKFGKQEVLSAYRFKGEYRGKGMFVLQIFNKEITRFAL